MGGKASPPPPLVVKVNVADRVKCSDEIPVGAPRMTPRECGSCSLCCNLFLIDEPELRKPANRWCKHCSKPGCSIYDSRPSVCRGFVCGWLAQSSTLSDLWFPANAKMVWLHTNKDGQIKLEVDPRTPDRWREASYIRKGRVCDRSHRAPLVSDHARRRQRYFGLGP